MVLLTNAVENTRESFLMIQMFAPPFSSPPARMRMTVPLLATIGGENYSAMRKSFCRDYNRHANVTKASLLRSLS